MATKMRPGLYTHMGYTIEKYDEKAERYPGDLDYGKWVVSGYCSRWLKTFSTLESAIAAIEEEYKRDVQK